MIKVDGLEPTQEFKEYIEKEKRGEGTDVLKNLLKIRTENFLRIMRSMSGRLWLHTMPSLMI